MAPLFCASITGATSRAHKNGPVRLTDNAWFHCATG
jgi:hypothetical protein